MPSVPSILRMRQRRHLRSENKFSGKLGFALALLVLLLIASTLLLLPLAYGEITRDLPSPNALVPLLEPPDGLLLHPTLIYDQTGEHVIQEVQNYAVTERRYLPVSAKTDPTADEYISPASIDAAIAIVDPGFWEEPGFSLDGVFQGEPRTLPQRLVLDLLLANENPGIIRNIRERILAWQLVTQFGHDKVLEWYLNSLYYGNLAYGIDSAAQVYFDKSASDLSLAEAALLTAVGEAPALNPLDSPEEALKRQQIVLEAMVAQGLITPAESDAAASLILTFREPVVAEDQLTKLFTNLVWEQLSPYYDLEQIERGGYKIITSLDYDLQVQATCTRYVLLTRLGKTSFAGADLEAECAAARLLPTLPVSPQALPEDVSAAVIILDPSSGQVRALVGDPVLGTDPTQLPGRAPGSMLTPYVYLTAFTRGFSPATLLWDIPVEIPGISFPESDYHGPVRLRTAMANDYLVPAIQTMSQIGADNVWHTTNKMGLTSFARYAGSTTPSNCRGCDLLFDGGQVSLSELALSYSIFANQGQLTGQAFSTSDPTSLPPLEPISVLEISDIQGHEILTRPRSESRLVITPQLAYLVSNVLSDEAARWPALGHPNPLEIGRSAAAKVGTTAGLQDTWTIGYTPEILVGVWVGNPSTAASGGEIPWRVSAALWNAVIKYASQDVEPVGWQIPPGISAIDVCDPSGQLPTRHCPAIVSEVFLNGSEPTQFDSLYQAYQINRETEFLATVFTPLELVEERVYMNLPPMANQWAEANQIPVPPESFDVIAQPPVSADAHIGSPVMFSNIRGEIQFLGTASGDDFISYRLQAGQGLNPQVWLQISPDETSPVEDGILASWDTSGLNGLYAVQLIVLRDNQRIDTNTIQVTVDNQAPEVSIPYPENGQVFPYQQGETITLQALASDNIGIESVVFYIGNSKVIEHTQPPYAVPWRLRPGVHQLHVKVKDFAGNTSEAAVEFSVAE